MVAAAVSLKDSSSPLVPRKRRERLWSPAASSSQAAEFWQEKMKVWRAAALSNFRKVNWTTFTGDPSAST
jgi:hypothetical protein